MAAQGVLGTDGNPFGGGGTPYSSQPTTYQQSAQQQNGHPADEGVQPVPLWAWFISILVILGVIKYGSEHEKSKMDVSFIGVSFFNWVTVGLLAMLFIFVAKVLANKYQHIPGLTEIVNAV